VNRREFLKLGSGITLASLFSPSAQAATADIAHGSRSSKNIALTFHGAGPMSNADSLLSIFKSTNTLVSVFAIGTWLEANPQIAKKLVDAGHVLGNHTMHHYEMKKLSASKVKSEINGCASVLKNQIGNHGAFFRPSGTQYSNSTIRKGAIAAGYKQCISYDVDSHDYQDPGKAAVINNVMKSIQNGSIVSLHFGHQNTVEAMPTLIEKIRAAGFNPVTLSTLLGK
jgi:peptidoglycan/xylan/chitin deacetylase (PgdA/CDA1 family)